MLYPEEYEYFKNELMKDKKILLHNQELARELYQQLKKDGSSVNYEETNTHQIINCY